MGEASFAHPSTNVGRPPSSGNKFYLVITPNARGQAGVYNNLTDYTYNVIDPAHESNHSVGDKVTSGWNQNEHVSMVRACFLARAVSCVWRAIITAAMPSARIRRRRSTWLATREGAITTTS